MNTKLIKQLESVGFEKKKYERGELMACEPVKGQKYPFLGFYFESETFEIYMADDELAVLDLFRPTFKQIIAAIKEHTGVDLQPKQPQRKEVVCFSKKMEDRLRENDNKGGWKACSNSRLLTGLKNNVSKLDTVIDANTLLDVANYAMMLFDNNMILVNYFEDKPKQTKAQRIEALEQGNQSLAEQVEELRAKQQGFEDLLKNKALELDKINERLNKLERNNSLEAAQKVLETTKEISNLALELKKLENESDAYVWANESILPKNVAEALTDKPKFKVGDEVVLKKSIKSFKNGTTKELENHRDNGLSLIIADIDKNGHFLVDLKSGDGWTYKAFLCSRELEHAPKLKFGGWAEVIGNTVVTHSFEIGQKVLLYYTKGDYVWCSDGDSCCLVARADLKPL